MEGDDSKRIILSCANRKYGCTSLTVIKNGKQTVSKHSPRCRTKMWRKKRSEMLENQLRGNQNPPNDIELMEVLTNQNFPLLVDKKKKAFLNNDEIEFEVIAMESKIDFLSLKTPATTLDKEKLDWVNKLYYSLFHGFRNVINEWLGSFTTVVATCNGKILGAATYRSFHFNMTKNANLLLIGVPDSEKGKGVGRKLLDYIKNNFKSIICVYSDTNCIEFYRKCGFIEDPAFRKKVWPFVMHENYATFMTYGVKRNSFK